MSQTHYYNNGKGQNNDKLSKKILKNHSQPRNNGKNKNHFLVEKIWFIDHFKITEQ